MKNLLPSTLLLFAVLLGRSAGNAPTPKIEDLASSAMAKTAKPAPKITTFLWFDDDAEEAIRFYGTVFGDAKVREETRWGDGGPVPKGTLMTARFTLAGQEFMALNGGPMFEFNEAISLFVSCETQAEIDRLWTKLIAGGGEPSQCGWLKDKYGLSWQIAPTVLGQMLQDEDAAKVARVTAAFMQMTKFDIAALQRAYDGR